MRKHLFWIIPSIIIAIGIFSVFYQNITNASEPPDEGWSRALQIGTTTVNNGLPVQKTNDDKLIIQTYEEGQLLTKTLNNNFEVVNENSYDIPFDKWTQVFIQENNLIYHDYKHIYDQKGNIIVSDAKRFYPLKDTILYTKDNTLYKLNQVDKTSNKLMDLKDGTDEITPFEGKQGLYLMTKNSINNNVEINVYAVKAKGIEQVHQEKFTITFGQIINHIDFAVNDQELTYAFETQQKQSQGPPQFYTYYKQVTIGSNEKFPLEQLKFNDPAGNGNLSEVGSINISYRDGNPHFIFNASGYTQTKFKENTAFNIYSASMSDNGDVEVFRKSNTPDVSGNPQWLDESTVIWLDLKGESNDINVSSSKPAIVDKAPGLTMDDWIRGLGKTLGMMSMTVITISISSIWFIWPVVFIVIMQMSKSKKLDEDPPWIFYTGVGIYMLAVFIFKDYIFVQSIYLNAPDYLTFNGSSYVFILLSAMIAYIAAQSTKKTRDWNASARISCFVGAHILMLLSFFGPYFI
ncbi:hypothetical protein SAMN05216232_3402 [Virgibacillus subterraneus]|uniref:Uncharacterized protein n=2 Tax=Virgibacillus TaxID=84406 RepID=A0A1H1GG59_9BACI|nr:MULTISPECIES: hypothetical protein [Virgibacillus]SDR12033.1 hypothetical protein SAMN05216231_3695 [Virgibacillus salinus]SEQ81861.1 hypothetical protein SAMN05216232_3402 [Virgibacillus subterraneus]